MCRMLYWLDNYREIYGQPGIYRSSVDNTTRGGLVTNVRNALTFTVDTTGIYFSDSDNLHVVVAGLTASGP